MSTLSRALTDKRQIFRFGVVGLINSAFGYGVIVAVLAAGGGDVFANACGFSAGLALSFLLNRRWTFQSASAPGQMAAAIRFIAVFAVAYGANLAVVLTIASLGYPGEPLVHLAGMIVYSVIFYLGSALLVFRRPVR